MPPKYISADHSPSLDYGSDAEQSSDSDTLSSHPGAFLPAFLWVCLLAVRVRRSWGFWDMLTLNGLPVFPAVLVVVAAQRTTAMAAGARVWVSSDQSMQSCTLFAFTVYSRCYLYRFAHQSGFICCISYVT